MVNTFQLQYLDCQYCADAGRMLLPKPISHEEDQRQVDGAQAAGIMLAPAPDDPDTFITQSDRPGHILAPRLPAWNTRQP